MPITDWPADERPREKLLAKGAEYLSDAELLAIFLRTGLPGKSAVDLARDLIHRFTDLRGLLEAEQDTFCEARGLGKAKYAQLQAVMEMARRYLATELRRDITFNNGSSVKRYLATQMRHRSSEAFAALFLDNQHRLICFEVLFQGTIDNASVHPREVVCRALQHNAAALILAHNHPSGVAEPSNADRNITERLVAALDLVDIRTLDHMVVGEGEIVSFAERGWL